MELPRFLMDPKAGFLELVVKGRTSPIGGEAFSPGMVFRPIIHRCFDMDENKKKRKRNINSCLPIFVFSWSKNLFVICK
jgi:hypothetical protein